MDSLLLRVEKLKEKMENDGLHSISETTENGVLIGVGNILWMFRPTIIEESKMEVLGYETAAEWPDVIVRVKRPEKIRVRFLTIDGEAVTMAFKDTTARYILQEIDRLNGVTLKDRASRYHWDQAVKRNKKK